MSRDAGGAEDLARRCVGAAVAQGTTLAVAESLTAGLVCARLADVPGASGALRGGVVAYATDLKRALLDVPADLLEREGPVHPDVATAMADGVRRLLGADVGVATTGVAGPGPADGHPAGTAFAAVAGPWGARVVALDVPGDRAAVRAAVTREALLLLADALATPPAPSLTAGDTQQAEEGGPFRAGSRGEDVGGRETSP
ncbi:CinA family protein [Pseudokineococcus marinus]|uniref:CinA family protein n=1 Tax=Pseudokineococcus marinus TaxID=351215 RepID=A0A849BUC0_9ACTN|nr:CinA family protein [Pseudokineococcus marinus]